MIGIASEDRVLDSLIVRSRHFRQNLSVVPLVVTVKNLVWDKQPALVERAEKVHDLLHQNRS